MTNEEAADLIQKYMYPMTDKTLEAQRIAVFVLRKPTLEWVSVEDRLPDYTDTYNVVCDIGSMLGAYQTVRSYRFERIKGEKPKWCIPDRFDEVVSVTHWMPLPPLSDETLIKHKKENGI